MIDYELLPYHRFGLGKYELLGVVYELDDYKTPSDEVVSSFRPSSMRLLAARTK